MPSRSRTWLVAGVLGIAAALLTAAISPAPFKLASLLSGEKLSPIHVQGGQRITVSPSAELGSDGVERLAYRLRSRGSRFAPTEVHAEEGQLIVDLAGATKRQAKSYAEERPMSLRFQLVEHGSELMRRVASEIDASSPAGIDHDVDLWVHDLTGAKFTDSYLRGPSRARLEAYLTELTASDPRLAVPPGREFGYEEVEGAGEPPYWRSYLLRESPALEQDRIESSRIYFNEITNQPEVLVEFDDAGARAFAELTGDHSGHKLAIVVNGEVESAPILQDQIDGGSASITMGSRSTRLEEAEALVDALGRRPIPGEFVSIEPVSPAGGWALLLARALLSLLAGVLVASLVRWLAPRLGWTPPMPLPKEPGRRRLPWGRLTLSAGALFASFFGLQLLLPGLRYDGLRAIGVAAHPLLGYESSLSVLALGLTPFFASFVLVELAALLVPRWRRLRYAGPAGRAPLAAAAIVLGVLLASLQGFSISVWLEAIGADPSGLFPQDALVMQPGPGFRLLATITLAAGSVALWVIASLVSRRGLGDGVALFIGFEALSVLILTLWPAASVNVTPTPAQLGCLLAAAVVTFLVLRARARDRHRDRGLRLPSSGLVPALSISASLFALSELERFGIEDAPFDARSLHSLGDPAAWFLLVAVTALLAVLFARSYQPSLRQQLTAIIVSAVFVALVKALGLVGQGLPSGVLPAIAVSVLTAVTMDLVLEGRARRRRRDWVAVWPIHRVALVDEALAELARHDIVSFPRGANLRTLLQFFGPFVPVTIFVPADEAERATELLQVVLDPSRAVPTARSVDRSRQSGRSRDGGATE